MTRFVLASSLAAAIAIPDLATAQTTLSVRPSLTATQMYDSNLFSTPSGEGDFISRVTPALDATYRSPLWTLSGRHSFDIERYSQHADLNTMNARQHALAGWEYRPVPRFSLAATAEYSRTQSPGELNTLTGLAFTRATAQRFAAQTSATRTLNERTTATIDYGFTQDRLAGGPAVGTQAVVVGGERRLRPRTSVSARYRVREFSFASGSIVSQTVELGWVHDLSSRVRISIDGGPSMASGSPSLDVAAVLSGRARSVTGSIAYARTQGTALGLTGLIDTESVTASGGWRPRRTLQLNVSPAFYRSTQGTLEADVYRVAFSATQAIAPMLAVEASFDSRLQRGVLYPAFANQTIPRQEFVIRLIAAPAATLR